MSRFNDFVNSDTGARARYQQRKRRRVHILIHDIEPQSKKMPSSEQDRFQAAVAEQLALAKRAAFKGDLALKLSLATTRKNAPQAHTIAKNLLDLFGERRAGVVWPRRHLLYKDDRQIQALSVTCRHGESDPLIMAEAKPFTAMLDDLELAANAVREAEMSGSGGYEDDNEAEWIDTYRGLIQNQVENRRRLGDSLYDAYFKMTRWYAQRALLRRSGVTIPVLGWMYGLPRGISMGFGKEMWAHLLTQSKLRLQIGELPIAKGSSDAFKKMIEEEIKAFKERWDWIINPLVIPVALEVVIRPNPSTPAAVLHDLDNIVRDYLLPGIVPSFGTVSDLRWTVDFDELERKYPEMAASWGPNPTPPPGTKQGVTRYEAWRLPSIEGEPGFVSVALVADADGKGGLMSDIDESIRTWATKGGHNPRYW